MNRCGTLIKQVLKEVARCQSKFDNVFLTVEGLLMLGSSGRFAILGLIDNLYEYHMFLFVCIKHLFFQRYNKKN